MSAIDEDEKNVNLFLEVHPFPQYVEDNNLRKKI
jgi:hypothetical protein